MRGLLRRPVKGNTQFIVVSAVGGALVAIE